MEMNHRNYLTYLYCVNVTQDKCIYEQHAVSYVHANII